MDDFIGAIIGVCLVAAFIIYVLPWLLLIGAIIGAIIGICCLANKAYKNYKEELERETERQRRDAAQWQQTTQRISHEIESRFPITTGTNIDSVKEYINRLKGNSKDYAISIAYSKIDRIKEFMDNSLSDNRFNDAYKTAELLLILEPKKNEYKNIIKKIGNIQNVLNSESVYILSKSYGIANSDILTDINQIDRSTIENIKGVDMRHILWSQTLQEPFDKYRYRATTSMFINVENESQVQIDHIASLIFLEARYGSTFVENLEPRYNMFLSRIATANNSSVISSLASMAAWCKNTEREKYLLELIESPHEQMQRSKYTPAKLALVHKV